MVFGPIWITRWPPWPLIGWDIFNFSSETAIGNSTKPDRKQDLNDLDQICGFWANRKKMAALVSDRLRHFLTSPLKPLNRIQWNLTGSKKQDLNVLYQVCVFSDRSGENKMAALASDWLRHFPFHLWNRWTEFNEIWNQYLNVPYQVSVFRADQKKIRWPSCLICQ